MKVGVRGAARCSYGSWLQKGLVEMSTTDKSQIDLVKEEYRDPKGYAKSYEGISPDAHFFNMRLKRVSELIPELSGGKVLDVGCGPGLISAAIIGKGADYYGVDVSSQMVEECIRRYGQGGRYMFSEGRGEELPFIDSYFDLVLCLGALEYMQDVETVIKELSRVVKKNGYVIVSMLNKKSPYRIWELVVFPSVKKAIHELKMIGKGVKKNTRPQKLEMRLLGEDKLRHLLNSEGLDVQDVVYYDFNIFLSPLDYKLPNLSVQISRKLEFLYRSRLKKLGTAYLLKCVKK